MYLVTHNMPHIYRVKFSEKHFQKVFVPGSNEISEEEWSMLEKHPLFKTKFKLKNSAGLPQMEWVKAPKDPFGEAARAVVVVDPKGKNGKESVDPFEGLDKDTAKDVIAKTFDLELLEGWKTKCAKKYCKLIDDQIDLVNAQNEPTKEESEK